MYVRGKGKTRLNSFKKVLNRTCALALSIVYDGMDTKIGYTSKLT